MKQYKRRAMQRVYMGDKRKEKITISLRAIKEFFSIKNINFR
jgi:hypothetical protein